MLVVGTSLTVYPAASLVQYADRSAQKVLVALDMEEVPRGFTFMQGRAAELVPVLAARWLSEAAS